MSLKYCNHLGGEERVALLLSYFGCLVSVNVLWLFLTVPRVGLQCLIVVFPDHTNLFLLNELRKSDKMLQL